MKTNGCDDNDFTGISQRFNKSAGSQTFAKILWNPA